jgi:hypothetical protein
VSGKDHIFHITLNFAPHVRAMLIPSSEIVFRPFVSIAEISDE